MEALPLPLFARVVAFAVHGYAEDVVPKARSIPATNLRVLALVSRAWASSIRELVAQHQRSTVTLDFQNATRCEVLDMRRKVALRGKYVWDLRVSMGKFTPYGEYFMKNHGLHFVNDVSLGWDALLAHVPNLRRLDLSSMPLDSPHVRLIVEAAVKHCLLLEALILPGKERQDVPSDLEIGELMVVVYGAIKQWHDRGTKGGLRQLTVPSRVETDRFHSTTEYLEHVIEFCPRIEYLDGHMQSLRKMDRLTCQDMWTVALPLWERFNTTCTQLKEFNWVVAPFADPFFKVFGEHFKPQLEVLSFSVNMLWSWSKYFRDCGEGSRGNVFPGGASSRAGYGYKAVDASAALKSCPKLRQLEVSLYHPLHPNVLDDPEMAFHDDYDFMANHYPEYEVLNPDIFDDKFCETAAKFCPYIERFTIWEVLESNYESVSPIQAFTDRGLVALSKLNYLSFVDLRPVNCTGDGVFDFLNGFSDEFTGQRVFEIAVGGSAYDCRMDFYDVLTALLERLDTTDETKLRFANKRFVLRLKNASLARVEAGWSEEILQRVEPLVNSVKAKHPNLRIRITTQGREGNSFRSVIEFGLYTAQAELSAWYGWDDEQPDRNISFANRGRGSEDYGFDVDSLPPDPELPADYFYDYYDDYDDYDDYGDGYDGYEDDFYGSEGEGDDADEGVIEM